MYSILFFIASATVIIGAKKFVKKVGRLQNKTVRNRWIWGILSMISLAVGILLIPGTVSFLKLPFIVFAIFSAMVFFEMTRIAIENAMAIHDENNEEKMKRIREAKNAD
ncbi:hypothetical protein [Lactococcus garvieae]|uniref:hypothetical protein n=1 Tax=Lactococcus garvieae TaxID=1363 RepID=UPI00254FAC12|nr:hypothetical protein [Lactococcus garvieae]